MSSFPPIKIGIPVSLTGQFQVQGQQALAGLQAWVNDVNVSGGVSVNTVPDECLVEVDRRVIPGENGAAVIDDVREYLEQNVDVPFEFLPPWLVGIPLPDEGNGDWALRLQGHVADITGPRQLVGVP